MSARDLGSLFLPIIVSMRAAEIPHPGSFSVPALMELSLLAGIWIGASDNLITHTLAT